jgi:hypothetical protein
MNRTSGVSHETPDVVIGIRRHLSLQMRKRRLVMSITKAGNSLTRGAFLGIMH